METIHGLVARQGFRKVQNGFSTASICLVLLLAAGTDTATALPGPDRQTRIINGSAASISSFPWQVALLDNRYGGSPRQRYFCTGSRVAPDLVITAGHCVINSRRAGDRRTLRVVSGRTFLGDTSSGQVRRVDRILVPQDVRNRPRYRERGGTAVWDVALLKLNSPVTGAVIQLAGDDEAGAGRPGRRVQASGWGVTDPFSLLGAKRLRAAGQVILPDRVCRRDNGKLYRPGLMLCFGSPKGHTSACFGDSGGPLVSRTSAGRRLVGITSFGDSECRGNIASVDARVSGDPIRSWVRQTALEVSGLDPVGSGGAPDPRPGWCRVPWLRGKSVPAARRALRSKGCRIGRIQVNRRKGGRKARIIGSSLPAGWLAPAGQPVNVAITRR